MRFFLLSTTGLSSWWYGGHVLSSHHWQQWTMEKRQPAEHRPSSFQYHGGAQCQLRVNLPLGLGGGHSYGILPRYGDDLLESRQPIVATAECCMIE